MSRPAPARRPTPDEAMREPLASFPGVVLEIDVDGIVRASNGRLDAELGRDVVGRPFAELLDRTSQRKWDRLLAKTGGPSGDTRLEVVVEEEDVLELFCFVVVWPEAQPRDRLWLIEHRAEPKVEAIYSELSTLNDELVNTQRELSKERAHLARAVERETEARANAEEAVRMRDSVMRIVAHDLRNPLNTITMSADLLEAGLAADQESLHFGIIRRAARRMNRLIADLLDLARLQAGRSLPLERRRQHVAPLIGEACEMFREEAARKRLRLECDAPDDLPRVEVDRDRMLQVFSNLIGNAVKFTPDGGSVTVRAEPGEDEVVFSVADTGPGIPEEERRHLFDPFWQARRTAEGAGLGLAIAKGIVESHGGRVRVESEVGRGSTFVFSVPSVEA